MAISLTAFFSSDYNILNKLSGFTTVRDELTKTQYAYNNVGFVSYDDERAICDKTEYALDRNLNGYIIWEISGDLMPDLSTPLLDAINNRLNKPGVRCDSVGSTTVNEPKPIPPTTPPPPSAVFEHDQTPSTPVSTPKPIPLEQPILPTVNIPAQNSKATLSPTQSASSQANAFVSTFYPHFTNDGTPAGCRNDGNAPKWITSDMMRSSRQECCSSYFSHSTSDQCNAEYPFYPNFNSRSCVNDGNHPNWMAGDYLVDNKWTCCRNFFRDKKMLEKCAGKLG